MPAASKRNDANTPDETYSEGESPPQDRSANRPARLSINLGTGPATALRELMERKDITATEAIRRAISVWKFIEDEQERGNHIAVVETVSGKQNVREVIFHME